MSKKEAGSECSVRRGGVLHADSSPVFLWKNATASVIGHSEMRTITKKRRRKQQSTYCISIWSKHSYLLNFCPPQRPLHRSRLKLGFKRSGDSPCALPVLLPNWTGQKNERNNNSFWEEVWRANKRDYSLHIRFSEICTEWNSVFRFDLNSVTFCNSHRLSVTGSLFRSEKSLNESATKNMGLSSNPFFHEGF